MVEAVYAALAEAKPRDFEYATYRLDDGTTFVHVARLPDTENPLAALPAFAEFQRSLASGASSSRRRPERPWSARTGPEELLVHSESQTSPSTHRAAIP